MAFDVGQIIAEIKNAKTKKDRIAILIKHKNNIGLLTILRLQFDDRFVFDLPSGDPPLIRKNDSPGGLGKLAINSIYTKLHILLTTNTKITRQKKEQVFLNLLEDLDKEEQDIMLLVKDKKLNVGITRKMMDEVFPGILPPVIEKPPSKKEDKVELGVQVKTEEI